jgi:Tfp pilus assembly protein PilN
MRAVNLLPREEARSTFKKSQMPVVVGVVAGIFVMTILCAGFLLENATVTSKRSDLDAARAELALVPPPPPKQSTGDAALAGVEAARATALQTALNGRVAWDRVMREISLVLPSDVWLNNLTLASPTFTQGKGGGFQLSGNAYSHEGVARLLSRLALVPDIQNVLLDHSNQTTPGKHGIIDFKITADVRQPGATS